MKWYCSIINKSPVLAKCRKPQSNKINWMSNVSGVKLYWRFNFRRRYACILLFTPPKKTETKIYNGLRSTSSMQKKRFGVRPNILRDGFSNVWHDKCADKWKLVASLICNLSTQCNQCVITRLCEILFACVL